MGMWKGWSECDWVQTRILDIWGKLESTENFLWWRMKTIQGTPHVRKLLTELQMVFPVITWKTFNGFRRILRVASALPSAAVWALGCAVVVIALMPLVVPYLSLSWANPIQCRCRTWSTGRTMGEAVCCPCFHRVWVMGTVGKPAAEEGAQTHCAREGGRGCGMGSQLWDTAGRGRKGGQSSPGWGRGGVWDCREGEVPVARLWSSTQGCGERANRACWIPLRKCF